MKLEKKFKAIIGLGNPHPYQHCRHNVGEMALSFILDCQIQDFYSEELGGGLVQKNDIIYFSPMEGGMNESGIPVSRLMEKFNLSVDDILIVYDDVNLDIGDFKLTNKRSTGGHNGIKSISNALNSQSFYRFPIGIGKSIPLIRYVLSPFSEEEIAEIKKTAFVSLQTFLKENALSL